MNRTKQTFFAMVLIVLFPFISLGGELKERVMIEVDLAAFIELHDSLQPELRDTLDLVSIHHEQKTAGLLVYDGGFDILAAHEINWQTLKSNEELRNDRIDSQYMDYSEVTTALSSYESFYPSIAKRYELAVTQEGRKVYALKISDNVATEEDEPAILITGLHEAREIMSTEIAMDMADYLVTNYGSDPDVNRWVDTWEIWIVPMVNPDGSAYCWNTDQYWIKNRRDNGDGTYGVNLGHNYPFKWGECFGSSSAPSGDSFRGPSPGSEPEVEGLTTLAQEQNFAVVLSYHSFNEFMLAPYGCYGELPPDDTFVDHFGNSIAGEIQRDSGATGYSYGSWWELLYANDGDDISHHYSQYGSYAYSIQVNSQSYYPDYSLRDTTVQRNRPGWQKALDLFHDGCVLYGHVEDACTGTPLQAEIFFNDYPMTENEAPRYSDPSTGRYTRIGRPGTYTLAVTAPGYVTQLMPVTLSSSPRLMNLSLTPVDEADLVVWWTEIDDSSGDGDAQLDPGETVELKVLLFAPSTDVTGISGTLSTSDSYITISDNSATWPNLASGDTGWSQGNSFTVTADYSAPENHQAILNLNLDANEDLCNHDKQVTVEVKSYNYMCPWWEETMDADPNWTITAYETSGNPDDPENNWEFGVPYNGPASAYTGQFVYGTGLNGNYDNNWTLCLTMPPFDFSDMTDVTLKYARFLQVESGYDRGRVRVRDDPGGSWTTIFDTEEEPDWSNDTTWTEVEMDISQYADSEPYFEIRFDVRADYTINYPGHFLDDVMICCTTSGSVPPPPTPTLPPTWTPTAQPSTTPTFTPTPPNPSPTPTFTATATVGPGTPTSTPMTPTHTPTMPTHTPSATPTVPTPTPTPTNDPNNTPTPTWTPDQSPTPKPSHSPTPTATSPDDPTATPEPTSTPDIPFAIELELNDDIFTAGEEFDLQCHIQCHGQSVTVDQYIILDVYGTFFFHPTWTETPENVTRTFYDGYDAYESILNFTWPTVSGHASDLKFYAGCVHAGTVDLIGDISMVTFAY